jgi:hypothetical protein
MAKVGYEKPILVKLGFDDKAMGADTCTAGPQVAANNCNPGSGAKRNCVAGTAFGVPTTCISGPANVS